MDPGIDTQGFWFLKAPQRDQPLLQWEGGSDPSIAAASSRKAFVTSVRPFICVASLSAIVCGYIIDINYIDVNIFALGIGRANYEGRDPGNHVLTAIIAYLRNPCDP
jgi:hypothetical protein